MNPFKKSYCSVAAEGQAEIIEKKSRFIASVARVEYEEEAAAFIKRIAGAYPDATHNCYAYVVGLSGQYQKASDDGEPSGTAGRPILEVIKHEGLVNTVVVVTRYFGGTLLGAGGLIRAYTEAAKAGINQAGKSNMAIAQVLSFKAPYGLYGRIEREISSRCFGINEIQFGEDIALEIVVLEQQVQSWLSWLNDISAGEIEVAICKELYYPVDDNGCLKNI